ncbi:hypothetical protein [Bradyrhizobium sp.]
MTLSHDSPLRKDTQRNGAGFEIFKPTREPARAIRIHLCGADIHSTFTSLALVLVSALRPYGYKLPHDVAMSSTTQGLAKETSQGGYT